MGQMPNGAGEPAILVEELRKSFRNGDDTVEILRGVALSVTRGASVAIMGPSGSGKSTLLHILGTLDTPTAGRVRLAGRDPFAMDSERLADFRNREIGFVFQDHYLLPQCSALENVLIPTLIRRDGRSEAASRARALLERVGLADRADALPSRLSGGERQRVAIARALVNAPAIVLCDEPTGALDKATAESVADCFVSLQKREAVALVVVTHNEAFARRFDRVLRLERGTVAEA